MKLLKKSVLSQDLNNQRKMQIDEGVHIANKIDALRKSLNELEVQHQNFIQSKQIELDNQFKSLESEIKEKRLEIKTLEERRIELLKPLDEEHEKLNQREEGLKTREKEFGSRFIELKQAEKLAEIKYKDYNNQTRYLVERIEANEVETKKINNNLKVSENKLKIALEREEEVERYISSKTSELRTREANLASREREIDIAKELIQKEKQEIIKRTILLEDREATLEREIKRQQNKWQQ